MSAALLGTFLYFVKQTPTFARITLMKGVERL